MNIAFCRFLRLTLLILCLIPVQALARPEVTKLTVAEEQGGTALMLSVSEEVDYKLFTLPSPPRLVIDLPRVNWNASREESSLCNKVRVAPFNETTTRFVCELSSSGKVRTHGLKNGLLTVIVSLSGKPVAKAPSDSRERIVLSSKTTGKKKQPQKPLIVIDPGHGGQDPGALGIGGAYEKDITLRYARNLKASLLATNRYRVILTRDGDYFIRLRERFEIARKANADLFISLHADSDPSQQAAGLSVYTLSENASDKEAEMLAARENKSDIIAGVDLSHQDEDVTNILIDLAQRESQVKSDNFADMMVQAMTGATELLPKPHRYAGFAVLKAPDIPSVLVELGFLSNKKDATRLKSRAQDSRTIRAMVAAVNSYFKTFPKKEEE